MDCLPRPVVLLQKFHGEVDAIQFTPGDIEVTRGIGGAAAEQEASKSSEQLFRVHVFPTLAFVRKRTLLPP